MSINRRYQQGFSFVEVITIVALLGVLASISYLIVGQVVQSARESKLDSDVRTLNRAVSSYLASGGSLDGVSSSEEVLAKLRTVATLPLKNRLPGLSSSMIDPRISIRWQSDSESGSEGVRAQWDDNTKIFILTNSGSQGIREFYLDDALSEATAVEENRDSVMLYSKESKWIWDYEDQLAPPLTGPTLVTLTGVPDTGPTPATLVPPPSAVLQPPVFSPPGGLFPAADFDMSVAIYNPNPSGSSALFYSLDYGEWLPIADSASVVVSPNQFLKAQAITTDSTIWSSSSVKEGLYSALITVAFEGYTDGLVGGVEGVSTKKFKIKNNNGHGNNYDGVDGSNPATLRELLEGETLSDEEIIKKLPKNSTFIESGERTDPFKLPDGFLFTGSHFAFAEAGASFSLGTVQYYNGVVKTDTEITAMTLSIPIVFELPEVKTVTLETTVTLAAGSSGSDTLTLSLPKGQSKWIEITLDGVIYQIRPSFAGSKGNGGSASISVGSDQTGVVTLQAVLVGP